MQLVGLIVWWYSRGWAWEARRIGGHLNGLMDFFSIDLLVRTLFSPFRQISAESVDGPINIQLRAFFDKLISRIIGGIVRTVVLLFGIGAILVGTVLAIAYLMVWAIIPLMPIAGLTLMLSGWIPWKIL